MEPILNKDEIASLPSLLPYASEEELRVMENYLATLSPGSFAQIVSQGRWSPAKHLAYLDQAIVDAIDQAAEENLDGLVVSMPPQHGKSMLCSHYLPAWYLGKFPDRRVILTSYEADFAASWGRKARDLLEQHGHLFGVRVNRRSSAANRWDLEGREGGMTAAGVGGPITGKGAHLLIVDDPIKNDEEARSSTFREKQWQWWQSVATTRLRPGALMVVIQTRWHRDDLTGRILHQARDTGDRWKVVKFPALAEEHDILGRKPGEALWPEVFTQERLEQVKATHTNYYWSSLYQQNPQAEGSAEWPDDFFGPDIWFNEWPATWDCKVVALDPSKGVESKFGDYSAFVMLMVSDGVLYVDADLAVRNTTIITETAVEIQLEFRPDWFGVEVNQFQELLANDLLRRGQERGIMMPIYTINNQVNKLVWIRRLTPYLSRHQIRFKGGSAGAKLLVEQLRDFPNGSHDDGPDALEMAMRLARQLFHEISYPEPEYVRIIAV
ncbi:Terminase-like family protein [Bythopirellula polymerisocia]|uniref:Terminase-like family protein n=2 Tax=Bythopirellula polymerisocia TaxID=2528003 RepID=A0A5C6CVV3_9BACT|nr:Terminase-like family protein [Bythopirellula polymerisocia]